MLNSLRVLVFVPALGLLACSQPAAQSQADYEALKKQVEALKAQQDAMQRDLQAIKNFLQGGRQQAQQGPELPGVVGASVPIANEPALGSASAKVTLVEVSDYHCPFCRRNVQQTFPQVDAEYIKTGKARYVFVHYPINQLHPDAFKSHEAAACAGDQGKFWEMHMALFAGAPVKDVAGLTEKAKGLGLDMSRFSACLSSGQHAGAIKESVARMERLGVAGTPMTLVGLTPAPGAPFKVVKYIYGAQPYPAFKAAIDEVLAQAK
jgi:protein-disulfide isomerase